MTSEAPELVAFEGNRTASFRYELLAVDETPLGDIDGVTGGSLEYSADSAVKAGGQIDVKDVDGIDWSRARIRPWAKVNGQEWPLGLFIPSTPAAKWSMGKRSWTLSLLGKNTTLEQDKVPAWVSYPAGTVVTAAVREQITLSGQTGVSITDSTKTLAAGMAWPAGTPRLTIINDLLAAIDYWSLWTDGYGRFRAEPYVLPANRPIRYQLLDGEQSIYRDDFTREQDQYSIPNRVVAGGVGTASAESLVGLWENTDPTSPWSEPSRGFWITHTESGVEAVDLDTLNAYARRRGVELSSATATIPVDHALVPLDLNDAVRFRRTPAGIDARHTVQAMTVQLSPIELMTTTYREVLDL